MNSKFDFKSISSSQSSVMGDLHRLLRQGEYAPFTCAPIFESKFVQVKSHSNGIISYLKIKLLAMIHPFLILQLHRYSSFISYSLVTTRIRGFTISCRLPLLML